MNKQYLLIFILLYAVNGFAQDRYAVFFKDKVGSPFSINEPEQFLSYNAIVRTGRKVTNEDLPVTPSYLVSLRNAGAEIIGTTKWLNGAIIELNETDLTSVMGLPFVKNVQLVAFNGKPNTGGRTERMEEEEVIPSLPQNDMLNSFQMNAEGYHGEGKLIAVLDGGFEGVNINSYFSHIYDEGKLLDAYNFVTNDVEIYGDESNHGTRVFSTIAALGDDYAGIATGAHYVLYVTEDVGSEYRIEEYNWLMAAERADSAGVDIITSSVGYSDFDDASMDYTHEDLDGRTAVITQAAEMAYERGMIVINSAGNSGNSSWQKVTPPADGEHVLAIGSVGADLSRSSFSSIGPVAEEWIKPDLMAMGGRTVLINDTGLVNSSGTSFAAPQVAGLVAGIWGKYPKLANDLIVNILRESADRAGQPDFEYGYGIPSYTAFDNLYNQVAKRDFYNVYPNPVVDDQVYLEVIDPNIIENEVSIQLFTSDGKKLSEFNTTVSWGSNPISLSLKGLSKGVYLLKAISKDRTDVIPIMKQL